MNGSAHKTAGLAIGIATLAIDKDPNKQSMVHNPVAAGILAGWGGMLPDLIEPASLGPYHRQLFHSFGMLFVVGYGVYKAYRWQPENNFEKCVRVCALFVGLGYLSHIVADAGSPRSLPLLGPI